MDIQLKKNLVYFSLLISLFAVLQNYSNILSYQRSAINSEIWRLWTAHWVHLNWAHFLLNMLVFFSTVFIFKKINFIFIVLVILFVSPLLSISLYLFYPDIVHYAGFSSLLNTIFIVCAIHQIEIGEEPLIAWFVLFFIAFKLILEQMGWTSGSEKLIGNQVLVESHLLGAIWGIILALGRWFLNTIQLNKNSLTTKE